MSYIINSTSPFISIKLTQTGRQQLAKGLLNFKYWGIGDSEINYDREEIVDNNQNSPTLSGSSQLMRPFDRQPNIKSYITPNSGVIYQDLNQSNINVIKAVVNNKAQDRGFFSGTTLSNYSTIITTGYTLNNVSIANTALTGGTTLAITSASTVNVGDYILLKLTNDLITGFTVNNNSIPLPNLWYKIQSMTPTTITVDRSLPNNSNQTSSSSELIFYPAGEVYSTFGSDTALAYWDSGTLSFNSNDSVTCGAVPVWNMNNVWCENLAGITGLTSSNLYEDYTKFGSWSYLGTKNPFLEYLCQSTATTSTDCSGLGNSTIDDVSKSVSIIHYTNNVISNLYGEYLFVDNTNSKTVIVSIPDIMYHRRDFATESGTTMGMEFVASGVTRFVGNSDIEYIDLIESPTYVSSPIIVGRVYPQLKVIVIHDDEIVAAISYKSNRSWTLPPLSATLASPSGGTSTGILDVNKTMYITYTLENNTTTGLTTTLPCQTYTKITNNTAAIKDVAFKISETDLLPYMRKIDKSGYDGLGFYGYKFKVLYQIVDTQLTRPDAGAWRVYDFTTTSITTTSNTTIDPIKLENQNPTTNGFIITNLINSGSTIFDITQSLSMSPNSNSQLLQFGDERFFYGNIGTYIGATIFKTLFDIRINSSFFNTTSNPTRSKDLTTNPPDIKVTEVGIYDTDKNLVIIGKFSSPITLKNGTTVMTELSIDF